MNNPQRAMSMTLAIETHQLTRYFNDLCAVSEALKTDAFASARKLGEGIDWTARQVLLSRFADRSKTVEHQPERIEFRVAGGTICVRAMTRQHVAQWQIQLRFIARQFGYDWGWRWDALAQNILHNPVAAPHGACAQSRGVLGKEHGHRQKAAAIKSVGIFNPHPLIGSLTYPIFPRRSRFFGGQNGSKSAPSSLFLRR
jgi:hypothetical protein